MNLKQWGYWWENPANRTSWRLSCRDFYFWAHTLGDRCLSSVKSRVSWDTHIFLLFGVYSLETCCNVCLSRLWSFFLGRCPGKLSACIVFKLLNTLFISVHKWATETNVEGKGRFPSIIYFVSLTSQKWLPRYQEHLCSWLWFCCMKSRFFQCYVDSDHNLKSLV